MAELRIDSLDADSIALLMSIGESDGIAEYEDAYKLLPPIVTPPEVRALETQMLDSGEGDTMTPEEVIDRALSRLGTIALTERDITTADSIIEHMQTKESDTSRQVASRLIRQRASLILLPYAPFAIS